MHQSELARASSGRIATTSGGPILPAVIAQAGEQAARRFIEFFITTIRNPNTRRAYAKAVADFFAWASPSKPTS